jgi:hypothetical protein
MLYLLTDGLLGLPEPLVAAVAGSTQSFLEKGDPLVEVSIGGAWTKVEVTKARIG